MVNLTAENVAKISAMDLEGSGRDKLWSMLGIPETDCYGRKIGMYRCYEVLGLRKDEVISILDKSPLVRKLRETPLPKNNKRISYEVKATGKIIWIGTEEGKNSLSVSSDNQHPTPETEGILRKIFPTIQKYCKD